MNTVGNFEVVEEDFSESEVLSQQSAKSPTKKKKSGIKMTVLFDLDHKEKLKAIAFAERMTIQDVIRQALNVYFSERGEDVVEKAVEMHKRYMQD